MATTLHHYMDGKRVAGTSGRFGDVFNPTTGEKAARVPLASAAEVGAAVASAAHAQPEWGNVPPLQRARVMFRFKELVERNIDEIARLVTNEHGKILSDAKGSVI